MTLTFSRKHLAKMNVRFQYSNDSIFITFCLPSTKPADCVPGNGVLPLDHFVETNVTEIVIQTALDDSEQVLTVHFATCSMCSDTSVEPANGPPLGGSSIR